VLGLWVPLAGGFAPVGGLTAVVPASVGGLTAVGLAAPEEAPAPALGSVVAAELALVSVVAPALAPVSVVVLGALVVDAEAFVAWLLAAIEPDHQSVEARILGEALI
jgi:hypothetical protein